MSVSEITETRQYLTFKLGNETFATDVAKVREVLDLTTITSIPRTPDFMAGVINLRGSVVPVVDLRLCFEMSKTEHTRNTCIVVVEVLLEGESTVIGALADFILGIKQGVFSQDDFSILASMLIGIVLAAGAAGDIGRGRAIRHKSVARAFIYVIARIDLCMQIG